ncbi:MAG: hypothetical protein LLF89_06010 [Spirochaetaceae bacterium]|nr:hypothetical protein [Spirochaetaceae bacterium]
MIYWNAGLAERLACSEEEKATLPFLIRDLLAIASKVQQEGVQSVQNESLVVKNDLLSFGFRLLSEGLAVEAFEEILAIFLITGSKSGFEFLKQCIFAETLLSIASGDAIDVTLRKLAPYCGVEKASSLLAILEEENLPRQS